jgi:antitoxin component YwqK of YwqJK toxin-antitoxin module
MLETIRKIAEPFTNSNTVYKICINKYIVILEKLEDTQDNEKRKSVINSHYAKFRADQLKVIKIIDLNNLNSDVKEVLNSYEDPTTGKYVKLLYKVGTIAIANEYDSNINNICSNGIHYFKTIDGAFYYGFVPKNYTGKWYYYYCEGNVECETEYVNGLLHGKKIEWHENNIKKAEYELINNKIYGKHIRWHSNGQVQTIGNYDQDSKTGKWDYWYEDGTKKMEMMFYNGKIAECIQYYPNSKKQSEGCN